MTGFGSSALNESLDYYHIILNVAPDALMLFSCYSVYNKVRNKKNGDSIYVRAMMDHAAEKDGELGFRKDDLLHIEDTMYNAQQGVWYAWIITDEGKKLKGGTVPSKDR